ncbi:MAG: methylmalonyl Co-A mutase-associated GTPase MeaB [Myxococcales bacterium]|nr:methylmalonyl Co-A mutase-associated GTPase MeaB [Myxococcales bacterium]
MEAGDRTVLARAITLVESNLHSHFETAQAVLKAVIPKAGGSIRVGITGVPGVGKSTFVEALGTMLCDRGHRVAVLAVDPSSSKSRGSILGDKTRMERLSRHPNAFIRPSPTGGNLGGVTRQTRETIVLCEAAGFDIVLIETVGVGQSEITVRSMVDFFMLLMLAGAGDELQGIKKGVIELADAMVVNKADGSNRKAAVIAAREYSRALRFVPAATTGWQTRAFTCSAIEGEGIEDVWKVVETFTHLTKSSGAFEARRVEQREEWMLAMIEQALLDRFYGDPDVAASLDHARQDVAEGRKTAAEAAHQILSEYLEDSD